MTRGWSSCFSKLKSSPDHSKMHLEILPMNVAYNGCDSVVTPIASLLMKCHMSNRTHTTSQSGNRALMPLAPQQSRPVYKIRGWNSSIFVPVDKGGGHIGEAASFRCCHHTHQHLTILISDIRHPCSRNAALPTSFFTICTRCMYITKKLSRCSQVHLIAIYRCQLTHQDLNLNLWTYPA